MSWIPEWAAFSGGQFSPDDSLQRTARADAESNMEILPLPVSEDARDDVDAMCEQDPQNALTHSTEADAVVEFWREAGPDLWFAKNPEFDTRFRQRFTTQHEAAARGESISWITSPRGSLALVLLLDQFPRNAFRDTPRMYLTDGLAREVARFAVANGHDRKIHDDLRLFYYLPFGHSEELADQHWSVALSRSLGQPNLSHAEQHREIVRRFGRFPHRNPILGRPMTEMEQRFLDDGGFAG